MRAYGDPAEFENWVLARERIGREATKAWIAFLRKLTTLNVTPWKQLEVVQGYPENIITREKPRLWLTEFVDTGRARGVIGGFQGSVTRTEDVAGVPAQVQYLTMGDIHTLSTRWGVAAGRDAGGAHGTSLVVGALRDLFDRIRVFEQGPAALILTPFDVELWDSQEDVVVEDATLGGLYFETSSVVITGDTEIVEDLEQPIWSRQGELRVNVFKGHVERQVAPAIY